LRLRQPEKINGNFTVPTSQEETNVQITKRSKWTLPHLPKPLQLNFKNSFAFSQCPSSVFRW